MRTPTRLGLSALASFTALLLAGGCPLPPPGGNSQEGEAKLIPFQSASELLDYFKQQASHRYSMRHGMMPLMGLFGGAAAPGDVAAEAGGADGAPTDEQDFSTTNLQEVGVDEADVFKSDGTYFYIARNASLRIVQATPADELAEVGQLDLDYRIAEIYLYDGTVIALARAWSELYDADGPHAMMWPPYYRGSSTIVYQIDVTDPSAPVVVGQVELDGTLVESRLVNDRLIVVLTIAPDLPENPNPLTIGMMSLEDVMPKMSLGGGPTMDMVPWERWLRPASPNGFNITAVVTLDAADVETEIASVAVLADAGTVYASTAAVYITDTDYTPDGDARERTAIHKLAFNEDGAAEYAASGSVPGRLLNQFSLSEHEGFLRVATHVAAQWWPWGDDASVAVATAGQEAPGAAGDEDTPDASPDGGEADASPDDTQNDTPPLPSNAVYVLAEGDGELQVVGAVEGIAPDEQLYAARFLGDHGFLVTFERIDPLFVLDLTDPENPAVVGELEVPGYSDYLHPLGDTHLIGVGRSVVTSEWGGTIDDAVQLSLFDVSDWANPTLVQQVTVGGPGSASDVSRTHKAFTLIEREGQTLVGLPVHLTPEGATWQEWAEPEFVGVLCYEVDPAAGFTELGRVASVVAEDDDEFGWWCCGDAWQRAAFIGDTVYAVTADGVQAAPLNDFSSTTQVTLAGE